MIKRLLSLALIAVMVAMCIPAISDAKADWTMYVYTENGGSLNVRMEPVVADNIIGTVPYGGSVTVRGVMSNGWTCIVWSQGINYVGYVQSRFLQNYAPGPKPTKKPSPTAKPVETDKAFEAMNKEFVSAKKVTSPYTVVARPARASGWVNLRWAPSTEAERIAACNQGKQLTVLAETTNWYQVEDPATGMIGFISRQYVTRQ
ncbi:MAG: SH3 domain-containing protein [Clostridia bacterium]|nr:SH3 domain-containing protein [Clostridia bacterium]